MSVPMGRARAADSTVAVFGGRRLFFDNRRRLHLRLLDLLLPQKRERDEEGDDYRHDAEQHQHDDYAITLHRRELSDLGSMSACAHDHNGHRRWRNCDREGQFRAQAPRSLEKAAAQRG